MKNCEELKEIKCNPTFQDIPIVVFTTSRNEKDLAFSRQMGAKAFITKPPTFTEWVRMMQSLAENWLGRRFFEEGIEGSKIQGCDADCVYY